MVQRLDSAADTLGALGRRPAATTVAAAVAAILLWQQPWHADTARRHGDMPTATVTSTRFRPEWLRVEEGACIAVDNRSENDFDTAAGTVAAGGVSVLCFDDPGVHRVKLGSTAYSGGFVYVDD